MSMHDYINSKKYIPSRLSNVKCSEISFNGFNSVLADDCYLRIFNKYVKKTYGGNGRGRLASQEPATSSLRLDSCGAGCGGGDVDLPFIPHLVSPAVPNI